MSYFAAKNEKAGMVTVYFILPCYNEEEVLPETSKRLLQKFLSLAEKNYISAESRIIFVDDGSKDSTWKIIEKLHNKNDIFGGLKLTGNCGHQNALLAGLLTFKDNADAFISLDADLQDDIDAVDEMIRRFTEGNDIVYGVRKSRARDTFFKKTTALAFYKLMRFMGVDLVYNHADYRLMSKRALNDFAGYKEVNLFLRGIIPLLGYKSCVVLYERHERFAGESKYPLKKMFAFAVQGITSFSIKPIRLITFIGFSVFFLSLMILLYVLSIKYIAGVAVSGWASMILSIWMLGGLQLLTTGVIGEYIAKTYLETKRRPRFAIEKSLNKAGKT
ncbi:MAG: glycosyltransferase family 2 protein [Spirochaetaceae bacterium]|nr:glycosyltransferase family 2 protein [Spirochaetaceae bacterium]